MHDFYLTNQILKIVLSEVQKSNLKKVKKIVIELGKITQHREEINPKNLRFNLRILSKDTLLEGAKIEIRGRKDNFWKLREIVGE